MSMDTYRDSVFRRFATGAVLALGFGTIWAAVIGWLGNTIIYSVIGVEVPRSELIRVAHDGTPRIDSYPIDDYSRKTTRDLDGREIAGGSTRDEIRPLYLEGEPRPWPAALAGMRWSSRIKPFFNERDLNVIWYFVMDDGLKGVGSFVGYERLSNRVIGYIGLSGLRTTPVPAEERIPYTGSENTYIQWGSSVPSSIYSLSLAISPWAITPGDVPPRLAHIPSGNILRVVDIDDGSVRTAFESRGPIVSVAIPYLSSFFGEGGGDEKEAGRAILVRTPRRVLRLDHAYNVIGTFVIPPEIAPGLALNWYEARDGSSVVTCEPPAADVFAQANRSRVVMVYQLAPDGAIRKTTRVELGNGTIASGRAMLGLSAAAIPAPAPSLVTQAAMAAGDPNRSYPAALAAMLAASLPELVAVAGLATALAAAAWRRAKVFGMPSRERAGWAAFVGLFGLPGWVGFRLHRRWPARTACPRCGARTPSDQSDCLACGEDFPAPAATGIEIFA